MMQEIADRTFLLHSNRGDLIAEDMHFRRCTFNNCSLSLTNQPRSMARVSRVKLTDCQALNSRIGPCHLETVEVENLSAPELLIVWGALLKHVVVKGRCGRIKINDQIQDPQATAETQRLFIELRAAHYASVDWALDISAARPLLLEIAGIPARSVIRDPETQIVVTKELLSRSTQLATVPGLSQDVTFSLQLFVEDAHEEKILVAPTGRSRKFYQPALDSFRLLRAAGLALPQ